MSKEKTLLRRSVIVSALFLAGAFYIASATKSEPVPIRRPLSELPPQVGHWREVRSDEIDQRVLGVLGVDDFISRQYSLSEGAWIGLYIGYYRSQRQGDSIHSPLNCLPGSGWNPVSKDILVVPIQPEAASPPQAANPVNIRINRLLIQKGLDRQVVLYWYQSHGRVIASEYWGKIYTVVDALRTNRTDAALVRIVSPINGTEEAAERAAEEHAVGFVKGLFPLLSQYLPD